MSQSPILSIVTISKEDNEELRLTLETVKDILSIYDLELIVVVSKGNKSLLKSRINSYTPNNKLIVNRDSGIFNAMNLGMSECRGNYIWFLNAGDRFNYLFNFSNLNDILNLKKYDILFCSVINVYQDLKYLRTVKTDSFPHQGFIAKRDLLLENRFDEQRMTADHLQMKTLVSSTKDLRVIQEPLVIFEMTGISSLPSLSKLTYFQNEDIYFKFKYLFKILLIKILGKRLYLKVLNRMNSFNRYAQ